MSNSDYMIPKRNFERILEMIRKSDFFDPVFLEVLFKNFIHFIARNPVLDRQEVLDALNYYMDYCCKVERITNYQKDIPEKYWRNLR